MLWAMTPWRLPKNAPQCWRSAANPQSVVPKSWKRIRKVRSRRRNTSVSGPPTACNLHGSIRVGRGGAKMGGGCMDNVADNQKDIGSNKTEWVQKCCLIRNAWPGFPLNVRRGRKLQNKHISRGAGESSGITDGESVLIEHDFPISNRSKRWGGLGAEWG
jgi:hypothetical protein